MNLPLQSIEFVVSPVGFVVILLILGLLFSLSSRKRKLGKRLVISGAVLNLVFVFSPLAEIWTRSLEKQYPSSLRVDPKAKIEKILILAGYAVEAPSKTPVSSVTEETLRRICEGIRLYRQIPGAKLIVPGGVVHKGGRPISEIMAAAMQQLGIPGSDIIVETKSSNTYTNLAHVKMLIGDSPFILVTSGCDLPRAMGVARKLNLQALPAPAGNWTLNDYQVSMTYWEWIKAIGGGFISPSYARLERLQWTSHEYLGMLWYRLQGWI